MAASMPRRRQAAARAALALLLPVQLASAYTWSFQSKPTQCEDLSIKISGSDGKPPYRVLIVPYGPSPLDNNIEARRIVAEEADGDSDTITFQLKYPENSQFVAVVSDANAFGSGGTSGPAIVASSSDTSCYPTSNVAPDWVFNIYPQNQIVQCQQTRLWWDEDDVQGTPYFTGVIPGGDSFAIPPADINTTTETGTGFSWTPNVRGMTQLLIVAGDNRGNGTGGSGTYTVSSSSDNSCLDSNSPSSTPGDAAGGSYPTNTDGASNGGSSSGSGSTGSDGGSSDNTGAIVGGVIGGVAGVACIALALFFLMRRKKNQKREKEKPVLIDDDQDGRGGPIEPTDNDLPQYYEPEPFMVPDPTSDGRRTSAGNLTESGYLPTPSRSGTPDVMSASGATRKTAPRQMRAVNFIQHDDAGPSMPPGASEEPETIELPPAYTNIRKEPPPAETQATYDTMDSPKRSASPAGSDSKRARLDDGEGTHEPAPINLDNAPGKRGENEPVPGGEIGNLPPEGAGDAHMDDAAAPPARVRQLKEDDEVGDVSMGDDEGGSGDENENEADEEDPAALEATRIRLEEQARKYLAAQTHEIIIPSYAAWFDMSKINPVEERALPEFFNSRNRSKTPAIYKDYRDFMINTYRLRPSEYLTVTACRRNLAGDVCAIMRVHAFLEQWGLINYQIDPETRPAALAPPFTGHFRVVLDTPRGLQSLHPGTRPQNPGAVAVNGAQKQATPASLEMRKNIYQTSSKSSRQINEGEAAALANGKDVPTSARSGLYTCDTCGADCSAVRYHSLKDKRFQLCQPCYLDGRFPTTMFSGDFVKLTSAAVHGSVDDDWTDEEMLRLLEGIEMYEDDWSRIEEYVGTRSAQQCIRKFLELPIEDPYLSTEGSMGPLRFGRVPFEQADNPVMSVVAFLAGVVNPGVAAEAAKTALHALTDGDKGGPKEEEADEENADNKMDEDKKEEQPTDSTPADPSTAAGTSTEGNGDSTTTSHPAKKQPTVPHSKVARAADLALKASARAARQLADAEDAQIRGTLASLIKLTLTKLEMKMSQFEELEDILEDERKNLESARIALMSERLSLKKMLEQTREQLAAHGAAVPSQLGTTGQGPIANEVQNVDMGGPSGPVPDGSMLQLS
ncbi:hypothetical protein GGF50DRAFT_55877 [Schizophyllum commune]